MSIRDAIDDAISAYSAKSHRSALVHSLLAVAAAARRKYPKAKFQDSVAFKTYLSERLAQLGVIGVERVFRGKSKNLVDILYEDVRCNLIHEAELPAFVTIDVSSDSASLISKADEITFGQGWIDVLITAVVQDPELRTDFEDLRTKDFTDLRFVGAGTSEEFDQGLIDVGLSPGRLHLLKRIMISHGFKHFRDPEVRLEMWDAIVVEPETWGLNRGCVTALTVGYRGRFPPLLEVENGRARETDFGEALITAIATNYDA